jgi:RHS repeat-associated protein
MRQGDVVYYIHSDHLGSTSVLSDESGQQAGDRVAYLPYGGLRLGDASTLPTDYTFTGQRLEAGLGLMHYGARFYSPRLGRFISADTLVCHPRNPQAWNRYSYVLNNPLYYIDPTGHQQAAIGAVALVLELVDPVPLDPLVIPAALTLIASDPSVQQALMYTSQHAQYYPAVAEQASNAGQSARHYLDKGGGDAGNADPNDPFKSFRNEGERYQYQTSGTRYEQEPTLDVNVRGQEKTVNPDNVVDEYLLESKHVDMSREFYSKQMGRTGMTGLDWHVQGWRDQIERLSLAAEQHGYQGVKVFVSSQEAVLKAINLYQRDFPNVEFIFQALQ